MLVVVNLAKAEDGYRLWLKYNLISDENVLKEYKNKIQAVMVEGKSETIQIAKKEFRNGLSGILGKTIPEVSKVNTDGVIVAGSMKNIERYLNIDLKDYMIHDPR